MAGRVTRLPKDPGPAAWNALLPDPPAAKPLSGDTSADWLVIGAGFAGLAAARRLSELQSEAKVVVMDAVRVGEGPAGRNSGFMIDLPHDLASQNYAGDMKADRNQLEDNRRGIAYAADMARAYGLPDEAFVRSGKINAAAGEKGVAYNTDFARHLKALGEEYELYDAAKMRAITGTDYYESGLFTPGCVMIQPAMFVRGVAAGLASNRVSIFENSPVTDLRREGGAWRAEAPNGQVRAKGVILAVNGHLNSFGYLKRRLMHVFTYASMTRALSAEDVAVLGGRLNWGVTPADPLGTTVRRVSGVGGDRIIIRNRATYDPSMEVSAGRIAQVARDHDRAFAARFPMLAGVEMEHRWGGRLCLSRNNVQVVGELEPGLWSACCQNGLGTAKGTLAGVLAAEAACGVSSPALTRALQADPPSKVPPSIVAKPAATAKLKWGEWRAGREL